MEKIHNLEDEIKRAIREIGQRLNFNAFNLGEVAFKSANDLVTELDKNTERELIQRLFEIGTFAIVAEESGIQNCNDARYVAHIDPIDGTKSFAFRNFESTIGLGIEDRNECGKAVFGIVYDFMRDIMYVGSQENGLTLYHRGREIPLLERAELTQKPRVLIEGNLKEKEQLREFLRGRGMNAYGNTGSFLLSMAQCAFGSYDAFLCYPRERNKGKSWDVAAGAIMLEERAKRDQDFTFKAYGGLNESFNISAPEKGFIAGGPQFRREACHFEYAS